LVILPASFNPEKSIFGFKTSKNETRSIPASGGCQTGFSSWLLNKLILRNHCRPFFSGIFRDKAAKLEFRQEVTSAQDLLAEKMLLQSPRQKQLPETK